MDCAQNVKENRDALDMWNKDKQGNKAKEESSSWSSTSSSSISKQHFQKCTPNVNVCLIITILFMVSKTSIYQVFHKFSFAYMRKLPNESLVYTQFVLFVL